MEAKEVYMTPEQFAAYSEAAQWAKSDEPKKASLGFAACEKILAGEDPGKVLEEMENGYRAFCLAQED